LRKNSLKVSKKFLKLTSLSQSLSIRAYDRYKKKDP